MAAPDGRRGAPFGLLRGDRMPQEEQEQKFAGADRPPESSPARIAPSVMDRLRAYLACPPEDLPQRNLLGLTEEDEAALHHAALRQPALGPLYRQVSAARQADALFRSRRYPSISIAQWRKILQWTATRTWSDGTTETAETLSGRWLPVAWLWLREKREAGRWPRCLVEAELVFRPPYPVDLGRKGAQYAEDLLADAMVFLQHHRGHDALARMTFQPSKHDRFLVRLRSGEDTLEHHYPLVHAMKRTVKRATWKYTLENALGGKPQEAESQEALRALFEAALEWPPPEPMSPRAYLTTAVPFRMGHEFERRSTVAGGRERVLSERLDSEAGSLDALADPADAEGETRKDRLQDPQALHDFEDLEDRVDAKPTLDNLVARHHVPPLVLKALLYWQSDPSARTLRLAAVQYGTSERTLKRWISLLRRSS